MDTLAIFGGQVICILNETACPRTLTAIHTAGHCLAIEGQALMQRLGIFAHYLSDRRPSVDISHGAISFM